VTPGTMKALAAMTDEGQFELLATAVLRESEPLCAAIGHVGITTEGKTRKSPLDGIRIVKDGDGQRLVAAHHTTTALKSLESKWLFDPDAPRKPPKKKNSKQTATTTPGDLIKTAEIVVEARERTPGLKATLFLTTNQEPDEQLVLKVVKAGAERGIDVEIRTSLLVSPRAAPTDVAVCAR
jgi:hypothetical protein